MADMKTLTIGSETFTVVDGEAVHCCAQDLTEEQKAQARANIGAAAEGSGGGAASDPVVFTLGADFSLSCNKTYDEAVAMHSNMQGAAYLYMGDESGFVLISPLALSMIDGVIQYQFLTDVAEMVLMTILLTPDGVTFGE